ncbi:DUF1467 family protein [Mesobaculum littorinae]|uniref:DUF1467 family protein n=1 Tax=Mesobaculum littorinae TaxID=2486419 RepID=A0A438AKG6_9RHOB|nr:DUF1467 family protein [Mesobaculum littorinae]RVV99159.1 DUF1467 family protein [Mesobaculum littorinae]
MAITSAIVLFAVIWFMALFVALPIRIRTQGDLGDIVPGTHAGAPEHIFYKAKFIWVTVATIVIWAAACAMILWGPIGVRDLDWFGRMDPPAGAARDVPADDRGA